MSKRKRYLSVLDKTCWDKSRKFLFLPVILAKIETVAEYMPNFPLPLAKVV